MTARRTNLPYLRLVEPDSAEPIISDNSFDSTKAIQTSLFSDASDQTLGFIDASKMSALTFQSLLENVRPRIIFDLRQVPSFSDGHLTRRTVFTLFNYHQIRYFDVAGALGIRSPKDAGFNPRLLIPSIMSKVLKSQRPIVGPVLFFVDPIQFNEAFIAGVAATLPNQDGRGWDIALWEGEAAAPPQVDTRDLVFISHANPEDNEIALWFATRLAAEGFDVWSDVTRLIGGEIFWDSIEEIIRQKAASFIVLLSAKGHEKPGVLDEVNVAITTERRYGLKNFVIPVRIDGLPFSEIRANLARKNVVDASSSLATALRSVVKALDGARVRRRQTESAMILRNWRQCLAETANKQDSVQWDLLIENSISIQHWPSVLRRIEGLDLRELNQGAGLVSVAPGPHGPYTFASLEEFSTSGCNVHHAVRRGEALTEGLIDGSAFRVFRENRHDILRILSQLVRQSWDAVCQSRGFRAYQLSTHRQCWYLVDGFASKNECQFVDHIGKERRRSLVGKSSARGVYWHFGVEAVISVSAQVIRLKPHVIFTEDGQQPIVSAARQHALRRGFCKYWWNDRWRDLLAATLQYLSEGNDELKLPVSPTQSIILSARLASYNSKDEGHGRLRSFSEPNVAVGFGQETDDPRRGLMMFGPVSFERNPTEIRVGAVGTYDGLELFERWCASFGKPMTSGELGHDSRDVPFLGFESVFGARWPQAPHVARIISRTDLLNSIQMSDRHQAVYAAVDMVIESIRKATIEDDAQVDIWFVVIPDEVYRFGRPNSRVPSAISQEPFSRLNKRMATRFLGSSPSLFPEDNEGARIYEFRADFHHQLKARLLKFQAITQVLRESSIQQTLNGKVSPSQDEIGSDNWLEHEEDSSVLNDGASDDSLGRQMQDPINVSWNLGTASFFKAGGRPWRVVTARAGVCYLGMIFKRDEQKGRGHACCGAQLFLDSGEGVVFKGAMGPWYSAETGQFHLPKEEAQRLVEKALTTYKEVHKTYPDELFIHGRTRFNREELEGFGAAVSSATEVTGVRITRTSEYKLFSAGAMPVKRGTALHLSDRVGLIWTSGFVDQLGTYQGRETPNPLRVEICGPSSASLETVLGDVLTLTKMNFNSSTYADGFPVTMRFADAIGDVLIATGDREIPPLPFRHYI